jgi:hypothetical protein
MFVLIKSVESSKIWTRQALNYFCPVAYEFGTELSAGTLLVGRQT